MPQFYFHVCKDHHAPDKVGVDLPDIGAVKREAANLMGEQMKAHPERLWADAEWHIDVTDDVGLTLFVVYSAALRTAASGTTVSLLSAPRP